jgi:hypothetical protein
VIVAWIATSATTHCAETGDAEAIAGNRKDKPQRQWKGFIVVICIPNPMDIPPSEFGFGKRRDRLFPFQSAHFPDDGLAGSIPIGD